MPIVPELWIAFTNICFEEILLPELLGSILAELLEHFIMLLQSCVREQFQKRRKRKRRFLFFVGFHSFILEGEFIQKSMLFAVPNACVMVLISSKIFPVCCPIFFSLHSHGMNPL